MSEFTFRNPRADELEVRVADKKDGYMNLLVYKDSRFDLRVLDDTVGNENWAVNYKREGDTLLGGIGIYSKVHNAFIWKWAAGAESNYEQTKGEQSDALKRAGFAWGIGRVLYTAPKIRIPESNYKHKVAYIDYDEKGQKIKDLQIVDSKGNLVFNYMDFKVMPIEEADRVDVLKAVCAELKTQPDIDKENLKKFYYYYEQRCEGFDTWSAGLVRNLWKKWSSRT